MSRVAFARWASPEEKLSNLDETKPSLFERFDAGTWRYITVLQTARYEFAEKDRVVLMGRSGQWLLRGIPHALLVRAMTPSTSASSNSASGSRARW